VVLLLPTCLWIAISALDYVATSWSVRETSPEAGGLPGLFLLKTVIVVTPILLALEGIAFAIRAWLRLGTQSREPDTPVL
jgi:TRAP-type mannitol/chloroaromatic compound transport system permease small subunit